MTQTLALIQLLFRHWARASLPNRLRKNAGRRASAGLFRLAYVVMMSASGYGVGRTVVHLSTDDQRVRGGAWIVVGALGLAVVWSGLSRGPTLRGEPSPLETPFLDTLPLRETSRLAVGLVERLFVYALALASFLGFAQEAPQRAVPLALLLATLGVVGGEAAMRVARVVIPPMAVAKARSYLLVLGQVMFLMALVQAPSLGRAPRIGVLVKGWPTVFAEALWDGAQFPLVVAVLVFAIATGAVVIAVAERVGYDKIDLVPTGRPRRTKREALVIDRIDEVLRRREPGGRWSTVLMTAYSTAVAAGVVAYAWKEKHPTIDPSAAMRLACGVAAFGSFVVVSARAARMASRDVAARALLSPLPIEPRALLHGKAARLRRDALIVCLPIFALFATPWSTLLHVEVAWRTIGLTIAALLAAHAAASIAFLTVGAGSKKGPMGGFVIESVLVLVPLLGVATAASAFAVVIPLLALAFVAREAGNSALRCVRWIDDGDDFERETPIWRALLVLAAYQSTANLATRLVDMSDLEPGTRGTIITVAAAFVLGSLSFAGRRDAPVMRLLPGGHLGLLTLPIGLVLGAVAGGLALVWHRFVLPQEHLPLAALLLVPAEEAFFRGWLLPCIEEELSSRRKWLAPLLGAFAFAAVHPVANFPPYFVLGVFTSVLYIRTRSLVPGFLGSAVYAAIVLTVG